MIRRLLARVLCPWPNRPTPPSCGCHPWFHGLGVHAAGHDPTEEQ